MAPDDRRPKQKPLVGFTAVRSGAGFVIHIVDDAGETFEIEASRENVELLVTNLQSLLLEDAPHVSGASDEAESEEP